MIPIRRRLVGSTLALLAVIACAPRIALTQPRPVRIGVLSPRGRSLVFDLVAKRLGELGYVEGKNLTVEFRSAEGDISRYPALARELIRANCDLFLAAGDLHSARALIDTKVNVPLVVLSVDYDPFKAGIFSNFRRPGGNRTGVYYLLPGLPAKRLELLREIVPKAKRFFVLADPFSTDQTEAIREAAQKLQVEIVTATFTAPPYDFEAAFAKGRAASIEAVIVPLSPVFFDQRAKIAEQALKYRLPMVGFPPVQDDSGFVVSYGIDMGKSMFRVGDIIASILKGAKAGDIPVEQPTEFELAVNLRTAKALGISIPPSIMLRADRVIE